MSVQIRLTAADPAELDPVEAALRAVLTVPGAPARDYPNRRAAGARRYIESTGVRAVTPDQPPTDFHSPRAVAEDFKRRRDLAGEISTLRAADEDLQNREWFPLVAGDVVLMHMPADQHAEQADEPDPDYVLRYDTTLGRWRLDCAFMGHQGLDAAEPWLTAPDRLTGTDVAAAQAWAGREIADPRRRRPRPCHWLAGARPRLGRGLRQRQRRHRRGRSDTVLRPVVRGRRGPADRHPGRRRGARPPRGGRARSRRGGGVTVAYVERKKVLLGQWEDVTGDRERDGLICALRAVERREGERRGWDQPARLWTLHLADIDSGAVEIRPVPARAWRHGATNPVDDLMMTAVQLGQPPADLPHLAYADAPAGIAAVALMTEGWTAPPDQVNEAEQAARAAGQRTFATNPHRIEIRTVTAVDINGHGRALTRPRNGEPQPIELITPQTMHAPRDAGPGRVPRSLFGLAHAARTTGWPNP